MVDTQKVGVFISQCRKEHSWTQKELGEKLELQIRQFPNGKMEDHFLTSVSLNHYAKRSTSASVNFCPERK